MLIVIRGSNYKRIWCNLYTKRACRPEKHTELQLLFHWVLLFNILAVLFTKSLLYLQLHYQKRILPAWESLPCRYQIQKQNHVGQEFPLRPEDKSFSEGQT